MVQRLRVEYTAVDKWCFTILWSYCSTGWGDQIGTWGKKYVDVVWSEIYYWWISLVKDTEDNEEIIQWSVYVVAKIFECWEDSVKQKNKGLYVVYVCNG